MDKTSLTTSPQTSPRLNELAQPKHRGSSNKSVTPTVNMPVSKYPAYTQSASRSRSPSPNSVSRSGIISVDTEEQLRNVAQEHLHKQPSPRTPKSLLKRVTVEFTIQNKPDFKLPLDHSHLQKLKQNAPDAYKELNLKQSLSLSINPKNQTVTIARTTFQLFEGTEKEQIANKLNNSLAAAVKGTISLTERQPITSPYSSPRSLQTEDPLQRRAATDMNAKASNGLAFTPVKQKPEQEATPANTTSTAVPTNLSNAFNAAIVTVPPSDPHLTSEPSSSVESTSPLSQQPSSSISPSSQKTGWSFWGFCSWIYTKICDFFSSMYGWFFPAE